MSHRGISKKKREERRLVAGLFYMTGSHTKICKTWVSGVSREEPWSRDETNPHGFDKLIHTVETQSIQKYQ